MIRGLVKKATVIATIALIFAALISQRSSTMAGAKKENSLSTVLLEWAEMDTSQSSKPAWQDEAIAEIRKSIAGRENEPAEKVFKDIETFKGLAASRLPGAMVALTGLIGVDCSYCHVRDQWEKNDKPAKLTARKHFEMQDEILEKYFDKQNKISCWTCHRGQPKAELLPKR